MLVLVTDGDGHSGPLTRAQPSEQLEQDDMLLEGLEHRSDGQREVGPETGQVGGAGEHDPLLALLSQGVVEGAQDEPDQITVGRLEPLGQRLKAGRRLRETATRSLGEHLRADPRDEGRASLVVQPAAGFDNPLLDPAGVSDEDDHEPIPSHGNELDVAHRRPGERRVLHDRDLVGQRGEQPDGPVDDVVEVDRALQEPADRRTFGSRHRLDRAEPVDEQPIARIGGHPSRRRVRGMDEALFLEDGHVVAHGRRRHPEVVPLDQALGAHRLGRADIVLDDGPQDGQPPFVAHRPPHSGARRAGESDVC